MTRKRGYLKMFVIDENWEELFEINTSESIIHIDVDIKFKSGKVKSNFHIFYKYSCNYYKYIEIDCQYDEYFVFRNNDLNNQ